MKLPKDIKDRNKSIIHNKSFIMDAGAGSGKTEQLSRRVLSLLAKRQKPESIICITFTKKAASEMKARIIKYLKLGLDKTPPKQPHLLETWELAKEAIKQNETMRWDLLQNPNRLQILTIDSFCLKLINNHPISNSYGGELTPIEDAKSLYLEAAKNYIEDETSGSRDEFLAYCGNQSQRAINHLVEIMGNRDQWLNLTNNPKVIANAEVNFNKVSANEAKKLLELLPNGMYEEICQVLDGARESLKENKNFSHFLVQADPQSFLTQPHTIVCKLLAKLILSSDFKKFKSTFTKSNGITPKCKHSKYILHETVDALYQHLSLVTRIALIPTGGITAQMKSSLDLVCRALSECSEKLQDEFRKNKELDFIEITQCALRITNPTNQSIGLLHSDNDYTDMLIDEYQDTSIHHHELVKNIISLWKAKQTRSLFLVGDPKQSLYLFRAAELGLFIDVMKNGVGEFRTEKLSLSVNFRSDKSIVDWVNTTFEASLPEENNSNLGAATYTHAEPFSDKTLNDAVNFVINDPLGSVEENAQHEAKELVETLEKSISTVPHETHAILIRGRSYLKEIDKELKRKGLKYKGIDLIKLHERQPIIDLTNLTKFLIEPNDTIALLGLLRAPFVGILQKDLFRLLSELDVANNEEQTSLWELINSSKTIHELSDDAALRLKRFKVSYSKVRKSYLKTKFRFVLEKLWRELNADKFTEQLQDNDLLSYFKLIEKMESSFTLVDWELFESSLEKLYVQPDPDATNQIQVMTIHKSKGLEFDNVFIPGMHKPANNSTQRILSWTNLVIDGIKINLIACKPKHGQQSNEYAEYVKRFNRDKEILEMYRLLYVACTRAIKRLYMFANLKQDKNNELVPPPSTSMLGFIWGTAKKQICIRPSEIENENEPSDSIDGEIIEQTCEADEEYQTHYINRYI